MCISQIRRTKCSCRKADDLCRKAAAYCPLLQLFGHVVSALYHCSGSEESQFDRSWSCPRALVHHMCSFLSLKSTFNGYQRDRTNLLTRAEKWTLSVHFSCFSAMWCPLVLIFQSLRNRNLTGCGHAPVPWCIICVVFFIKKHV
jgi:hypothetical protein